MTVRLHIERLVVEGLELTAADAARLKESITNELTARFAEGGPGEWTSLSVPTLERLHVAAEPSQGPGALGRHVGAALHRGLAR
jgi:hypothetical protein